MPPAEWRRPITRWMAGARCRTTAALPPPPRTHNACGTTGNSPWYVGPVSVTLTPTDATSGVATTYYKVDGGSTLPDNGSASTTPAHAQRVRHDREQPVVCGPGVSDSDPHRCHQRSGDDLLQGGWREHADVQRQRFHHPRARTTRAARQGTARGMWARCQ